MVTPTGVSGRFDFQVIEWKVCATSQAEKDSWLEDLRTAVQWKQRQGATRREEQEKLMRNSKAAGKLLFLRQRREQQEKALLRRKVDLGSPSTGLGRGSSNNEYSSSDEERDADGVDEEGDAVGELPDTSSSSGMSMSESAKIRSFGSGGARKMSVVPGGAAAGFDGDVEKPLLGSTRLEAIRASSAGESQADHDAKRADRMKALMGGESDVVLAELREGVLLGVHEATATPASPSTIAQLDLPEHKVVAIHAYTGGDGTTELSFEKGDVIVVQKETASGWWEGTLEKDGRSGRFPVNYTHVGTAEAEKKKAQAEKPKHIQGDRVRAIFAWRASDARQMSFAASQCIVVLGLPSKDGMWQLGQLLDENGEATEQRGLFPVQYTTLEMSENEKLMRGSIDGAAAAGLTR